MTQDELKKAVAKAAIDHIAPRLERDSVIGVGTCLLYTSDAADE